jgi:hypothetical protein
VQADIARPHCKMAANFISLNGMKYAPYVLDSPELAPSNYLLFDYIKGKLIGDIAAHIERGKRQYIEMDSI